MQYSLPAKCIVYIVIMFSAAWTKHGREEDGSMGACQGSKGMYSLPAAYSSPAMISSLVTYPLQFDTVVTGGAGGGRLGVIFGAVPNCPAASFCASNTQTLVTFLEHHHLHHLIFLGDLQNVAMLFLLT